MESFFTSTSLVALAEMGDKTQLLSLILAARYQKPIPIIIGIFLATLLNHAGAAGVGVLLANVLSQNILNWLVVTSFLLMAGWILIPDKLDENEVALPKKQMGVLIATTIAFFFAEMGDKTQVVTIALSAHYQDFFSVLMGTTLGMMLANAPVVYLGNRFANRLPIKTVHLIASFIFIVLGGLALYKAITGTDFGF